jgi:hypothetical protein
MIILKLAKNKKELRQSNINWRLYIFGVRCVSKSIKKKRLVPAFQNHFLVCEFSSITTLLNKRFINKCIIQQTLYCTQFLCNTLNRIVKTKALRPKYTYHFNRARVNAEFITATKKGAIY